MRSNHDWLATDGCIVLIVDGVSIDGAVRRELVDLPKESLLLPAVDPF